MAKNVINLREEIRYAGLEYLSSGERPLDDLVDYVFDNMPHKVDRGFIRRTLLDLAKEDARQNGDLRARMGINGENLYYTYIA